MPFQSEAQRRWMHANKPEMAKEWEAQTPKDRPLPRHVKGSPAQKRQIKVAQGLKKAFPR